MEEAPTSHLPFVPYSDAEDADLWRLTTDEHLAKYPFRSKQAVYHRRTHLRKKQQDVALKRMGAQADRNLGMDDAADEPAAMVGVKAATTDEEYETYFRLLEDANEIKTMFAPTQQSAPFYAPDDGLPIGIAFTGDWHCGASGVRYKQLRADMETIRDTDGLYAIGMGDFVEGVSKNSKAASALYSGLFNEGDYQEKLAHLRASTARGKWCAIMAGNHDEWIYQHAALTRTDKLASYLDAPCFTQGGGTVFVHVGTHKYVVAVRHNAKGNSRLNTTNAHRVTFDSWPEWENCDVIAVGHLHFNDFQIQTRKGGRCLYFRSGTYKTVDSYAADNAFLPEYGVPLAVFFPDERRIVGFRGDDFPLAVEYLGWLRARYRDGMRYNSTRDPVAT